MGSEEDIVYNDGDDSDWWTDQLLYVNDVPSWGDPWFLVYWDEGVYHMDYCSSEKELIYVNVSSPLDGGLDRFIRITYKGKTASFMSQHIDLSSFLNIRKQQIIYEGEEHIVDVVLPKSEEKFLKAVQRYIGLAVFI